MLVRCPQCSRSHVRQSGQLESALRAGARAYVDSLCPWCRLVYHTGKTMNSPLGAALCLLVAIVLVVKIKDSLS